MALAFEFASVLHVVLADVQPLAPIFVLAAFRRAMHRADRDVLSYVILQLDLVLGRGDHFTVHIVGPWRLLCVSFRCDMLFLV